MSQKLTSKAKIQNLRDQFAKHGINGYIVTDNDLYRNEYLPDSDKRLEWLTGFTGSAGKAIILENKAAFLTDSRYTIQAADQVETPLYDLLNMHAENPGDPSPSAAYIQGHSSAGQTIGYDPRLLSVKDVKDLNDELSAHNITLKAVEQNLIDPIWSDQPNTPANTVELFSDATAGRRAADKRKVVAEIIDNDGCDGALITMTDSVAWLLNIRSNDVEHVPVALSSALLHKDGRVDWFIAPDRVPQNVANHLGSEVKIIAPKDMSAHFKSIANGETISIDESVCAEYFANTLQDSGFKLANSKEPVYLPRACKTPAEQQAMRDAHIRDGVAVVKFLKWIEENGPTGKVSEIDVDQKLIEFRSINQEFRDTSFDTIAGWASNGAIVHYRATPEKHKTIQGNGLLLVDSGAQYDDGTTDITRTIAIGTPTAAQIEMFTRVLKGHIGVAMQNLPQGATGADADIPARKPLLDIGKNFGHGTGHGVGCYLSVHEDSAGISPRSSLPIHNGMILSNEPGYYEENEYGIRIESLIQTYLNDNGELAFDTITLAPIDKNLIDTTLLSTEELNWLNTYHAQVYQTLSPLLDQAHKSWLKAACHQLGSGNNRIPNTKPCP